MEATADHQSPLLSHQPEQAAPAKVYHHLPSDTRSTGCRGAGCCIVILGALMFLLLSFLAVKYSSSDDPSFSVENIYIPALDKASNDTTTISFHLTITNNPYPKSREVYYDMVNVTWYYISTSKSPAVVGNVSIPDLDLGRWWPVKHEETIETFGVSWKDARMDVSKGKTAVFRIQMHAKFHYPEVWVENTDSTKLGATVNVNAHGKSVKGRYWLSNAASVHVRVSVVALLVVLLSYVLL